MYGRITIDLTRGSLQYLALSSAGQSQHVVCSDDISLSGLYWVMLIMNRRSWTRQIVDFIHFCPIGLAHVMTRQITSCPSFTSLSQRCEPINPAPPVTKIRFISYKNTLLLYKAKSLKIYTESRPLYHSIVITLEQGCLQQI